MATRNSDYTESSIRVLKGLEPVKQRPGMYTRTDSPLHIVQEVIDNAADEALAGFCRSIQVTLHADGSVGVEDDGRGIPVGLHPQEKVPVVEIVFTRLHAGGKFGGGGYAVSGGLHGVGVSVVNALSTRLSVEVRQDGYRWTQDFKLGAPTAPLARNEAVTETGTTVRTCLRPLIDSERPSSQPRRAPVTVARMASLIVPPCASRTSW